MIDLKLNKDRLGIHWHYYRFKYVAVLAAVLIGANFLFAATRPQTPPNLRVDIALVSSAYNNETVEEWQQNLLCLLPPEQKELNLAVTPLMSGQEGNIYQVIAARFSANEGTIWIMPAEIFASYAQQGSFMPLDNDISSFALPKDIDLSGGRVAVKTDENDVGVPQQCGIPLDQCAGLTELFDTRGMVMAFPFYANVNYDNAKIIANYLLSRTEEPEVNTATPGSGFGFLIAANKFNSLSTSGWKKEMQAELKYSSELVISQFPFQIGREGLVADLLQARMQKYPAGMFVVPRDVFVDLARKGALMPLDEVSTRFKLPEGFDLSAGKERAALKNKTAGPEQLYGIPLDHCAGLSPVFNPQGMLIVFPNQPGEALSVAIDAANILLEKTEAPQ